MFTVLTVEDRRKGGAVGKLFDVLALNSVKQSTERIASKEIRYIRLVQRSRKINWRKICRLAGNTKDRIVYTPKNSVPPDAGFVPFEPYELRQRLCSNMAIEVLSIMQDVPDNLRIGIYDPAGDFADLPPYLLKYTDNLCVVTKNSRIYSTLSKALINETGAVLRINRSVSALANCGLIVSPVAIKERFTPLPSAVVLTSRKPEVYLPCFVYYKYSCRLPKELQRFCPDGVDSEVFGGALYSFCGAYGLGSVVPFVCMNSENSHTALSLRKYLQEQFGT